MDKVKPKRASTNLGCHSGSCSKEPGGSMLFRTNTGCRTVTFSSVVIQSYNSLPRRVDRGSRFRKESQTIPPSQEWRSSRLEPPIHGAYVKMLSRPNWVFWAFWHRQGFLKHSRLKTGTEPSMQGNRKTKLLL